MWNVRRSAIVVIICFAAGCGGEAFSASPFGRSSSGAGGDGCDSCSGGSGSGGTGGVAGASSASSSDSATSSSASSASSASSSSSNSSSSSSSSSATTGAGGSACVPSGAPECDDCDPCTIDGTLCGECIHHNEYCPCTTDADCDDGNVYSGEACGPVARMCSSWIAQECP